MTNRIAACIASVAFVTVAPAYAGSLSEPVVEPIPEVVVTDSDWSGFYAGVYGRNNVTAPGAIDIAVGGFAGYNMNVGSGLVLGVEGVVEYDPLWALGSSIWGGSDVAATANIRLGTEIGDSLAFVKAGAGYVTQGFGVWTVGAGVDVPVMDDWFVRAEYSRVDPIPAGPVTRNNINLGIGYRF